MSKYSEAVSFATEYDKVLLANNRGFRLTTSFVMQDGSSFTWRNAFYIIPKLANFDENDFYYCVFTEHYGFHVFHNSDVVQRKMFQDFREPLRE